MITFGVLAYIMISTIKKERQGNEESPKKVTKMQHPVMH